MANDNGNRQEANQEFANSSFLYGGNAGYIEELYAQYETNPNSVSRDWQEYFSSLKDAGADILKNADGASWQNNKLNSELKTFSFCSFLKSRSFALKLGRLFAKMLMANSAAFFAPASPIASVPTGMPAGICTMDKRES